MTTHSVSVLIVGGGPVGLALAIECGLRGIDCLVVEQRDGILRVPRMSNVSSRNMEFCRRWGIADKVRAIWTDSHPMDFVYVTTMAGEELARTKIASYKQRGRTLDYSPEGTRTCPQIYFDPIMAERAKSLANVEVRYRTRLETFTQDDGSVQAQLKNRDSGETETVTARYMVGCDGAGGTVREALGIELDGLGALANSVNIFFRSTEFANMHDKGWARFYRFFDEEEGCWSELIAIDGKELWRLSVFHDPSPDLTGVSYLQRLAGRDFDYEILDVSPWERRDSVAQSYGRGRVFLAGDTAHQCSPTGGVGMHTGVCESVNLAWKLQALFEGWGGPRLLESYEIESRPVAAYYVRVSTESYNAISGLPSTSSFRDSLAKDADFLRRLNVPDQLRAQFCYEDSPICVDDGTPLPVGDEWLAPSAKPGMRAPHCWLDEERSILDLFGDEFILLNFGASAGEAERITAAAAERGVPLSIIEMDDPTATALYERRLVLVRPDGHIAWRADEAPTDPVTLIDHVRGA